MMGLVGTVCSLPFTVQLFYFHVWLGQIRWFVRVPKYIHLHNIYFYQPPPIVVVTWNIQTG